MPGVSPNSAEVRSHLEQLARKFPKMLRLKTLEHTKEGRPIDVAYVTDPAAPANNKQHALIVAGQHGDEESSRMIALKLLDWLLGDSPLGKETRRKQLIAVMPNVNPDGAEADCYGTPEGVRPNLDHGLGGPTIPVGRAVETVAYELRPEVFVDIHARGHSGCSHDMVLFPVTRNYTEDDNLLHEIAARMCKAGEKSGIPHVTHSLTWDGWGGADVNQPSTTLFAYRNFKSLVLLTESAEDNAVSYPWPQRIKSGLNRLRALLELGNQRARRLWYEGYPSGLCIGMNYTAIAAAGRTAEERRNSRIDIWKNASAFEKVGVDLPEFPERSAITIRYSGAPITSGLAVYIRRAGKRTLKSVHHNHTRLRRSGKFAWSSWFDDNCTCALAPIPSFTSGEHQFIFEFQ
jgi:hypothetical protein